MRYRVLASVAAAAVTAMVLAASTPVVGQGSAAGNESGATKWTLQRTPWGDPDLAGIWRNEDTGTEMQRPAKYGNREFLTDAEVAELEKQALAQYEKAVAEADPKGPLNRSDVERVKNTREAGIGGVEYDSAWKPLPKKPGKLRWRRTSLVVDPPDGRIPPYTIDLIKRLEARLEARKDRGQADTYEDRNLNERCMKPQAGTDGLLGALRIVQAPGWVGVLPDGLQAPLLVPLDGRPQVSKRIRGWFGRSRGRWDGDKLVIETTHFNDKQDGGPVIPIRYPLQGYVGSGETLRRVETYRRLGPDQLEYGVTTDDPSVYVRPYTVLRPKILDNSFMMIPSACHEGNYGLPGILSGARADEADAMRAAAEAAEGHKKEVAAMRRKTEEWLRTGKVSDRPTTGSVPVVDR